MKELLQKIDGRKTYLGVIALTLFGLLGTFDVTVPAWAWTIVTGWTGVSVVHKGNKAVAGLRDVVVGSGRLRGEVAGVADAIDNATVVGGNGKVKK